MSALKCATYCAGVLLYMNSSIRASGGSVEIDQARALAGAVTDGDTPGFPVRISQPGSYRLIGNLRVTPFSADTSAIEITSDDVTLDLSGFAILGPTVASGMPVTKCEPLGTGIGIDARRQTNITILNGTIRGMGLYGIWIGGGRVERVSISHSGRIGIIGSGFGGNAFIDNVVSRNGHDGISAHGYGGSRVTGNTVSSNGRVGIRAETPGANTVTGNTVTGNALIGILATGDGSAVVSENSVTGNHGHGILVSSVGGSLVRGNATTHNGGSGIVANGRAGSAVIANSVIANKKVGLLLGSSTGYINNVATDNSEGAVAGGVQIGLNLCGGLTCR